MAILRNQRSGRFERNSQARHINAEGYVMVQSRTRKRGSGYACYELEHRVIMSELIGRHLRKDEAVHHRDGDRQNNIPENLELLSFRSHRLHHVSELRSAMGNNRRCFICKSVSDITSMRLRRQYEYAHADCLKRYQREKSKKWRNENRESYNAWAREHLKGKKLATGASV